MRQNLLILLPAILPIIAGILILSIKGIRNNRNLMLGISLSVLTADLALCTAIALNPDGGLTLWQLTDTITLSFYVDDVSRLFSLLTCFIWLAAGIFCVEYMKHQKDEFRFFGFYLIVLGVLVGLDYSANMVTFYVFYELMTLASLPLVLHELTKEAVMAGLKYLYYSIAGAFLALFGIFVLAYYTPAMTFTPGGVLNAAIVPDNPGLLLAVVFFMIVGFGTKAGMFPMHGWLPTAHPVAPAPASAVLSGLITKAGILGTLRVVFYLVGPDFIRGTWVQTAWILLTLLTIFMGSMLAYKESVMKKRLAYSTVSQVSYVMFGLALLHPLGLIGALTHVVFHSLVKNTLFLGAGAIIYKTGLKKVSELRGIGKQMPIVIWCFTLVSITLIGIPPTSGFISKWYLATGALASGTGAFSWFGPAVLLISALLTAAYLLPVSVHGFFPGSDYDYANLKKLEPSLWMLVPMLLMTAGAVLLGMFPAALIQFIETIAAAIL